MKKLYVFHPFLFSLFPVLFLYAYNIEQVTFSEIIRPTIIILIGVVAIFYSATFMMKNNIKASLIALLITFMFYSFGHMYEPIKGWEIANVVIGRPLYLLPLWGIVLLAGVYRIIKTNKKLINLTKVLNLIAFALIIMQIIQIGAHAFRSGENLVANWENRVEEIADTTNFNTLNQPPDIYYIILDGYASDNTLNQIFGYDNSKFTKYLEKKGFYIPLNSHSNYSTSFLSLTSSLNMEYINYLKDTLGVESTERKLTYEMLDNNIIMNILKSNGYKIIQFNSGWGPTSNNSIADWYNKKGRTIGNEFVSTLFHKTVLAPFLRLYLKNQSRDIILAPFSQQNKIKAIEGPKFIFSHIICPHPPYLFDAKGNEIENNDVLLGEAKWKQKELYNDQLTFISKKIKSLIEKILPGPGPQPIIILQADHGTASILGKIWENPNWASPNQEMINERMNIFNAYFLPGVQEKKLLYDSISPVNSFRIIFNHYFDTDLELLEDKAYFSSYEQPYNFINVTDSLIRH